MSRTPLAILACACLTSAHGASARDTAPLSDQGCRVLLQDVAAGDYPYRELTAEAACRSEEPLAPLHFDRRARAPVADAHLSSGTYLGRIALKPGKVFSSGDVLQLRFNHGPVAIERTVSPLSPVRAGQSTVFRSQDGETFLARLVLEGAL